MACAPLLLVPPAIVPSPSFPSSPPPGAAGRWAPHYYRWTSEGAQRVGAALSVGVGVGALDGFVGIGTCCCGVPGLRKRLFVVFLLRRRFVGLRGGEKMRSSPVVVAAFARGTVACRRRY